MLDYDVHHGRVRGAVDWRKIPDPDSEDDDEISATPAGLVAVLGLDPAEGDRRHVFQPGHEAYNPDMVRDERGRFTAGGGGAGRSAPPVPAGALFRPLSEDADEMAVSQEEDFNINMTELSPEHAEAVSQYLYDGFRMNRILRGRRKGEEIPPSAPGKMSTSDAIATLTEAIDKSPPIPEGAQLFRGVGGAKGGELLDRMRVGDVCDDKAFQSWTTSPAVAATFAQTFGKATPTEVQVPVLRLVGDGRTRGLFKDEEEHEMILAPGTRMRCVAIEDKEFAWSEQRGRTLIRVFTMEVHK